MYAHAHPYGDVRYDLVREGVERMRAERNAPLRTEEVDVELAQSANLGGDLGALDLLGELARQLCGASEVLPQGVWRQLNERWQCRNTAVVAAPTKSGAWRGRYALEVKKM